MGHPRHARPDAPRRRPREAGRHRQHRLHAREPRADGPPPSREDRSDRQRHPAAEIHGDADADVLVVGWGSTWAAIDAAVQRRRRAGVKVGLGRTSRTSARCRRISATSSARYRKVIVPELNMGQLTNLLRGKYLVDARAVTQGAGSARSSRVRSKPPSTKPRPISATQPKGATHEHRTGRRHHQERLDERPGGPLVPRLRRLRHPARRPDVDARVSASLPRTPCSSPASAARVASRTT